MRFKDNIFNMTDTIKKNFKGTPGRNFGIQLSQGTGSRVSRIGKRRQSLISSF